MAENIEQSSSSDDEMMVDDDDDEFDNFTARLDQFEPVIPSNVTKYYMQQSGLQTDDERVVKLVSLSVQKFMTDVINDCFQLHKLREKSNNRPATSTTASTQQNPSTAATTTTTTTATAATTTNTTSATTTVPSNIQLSTTEGASSTVDSAASALAAKKILPTTTNSLTLSELTHVLDEYGISVKKNFYYT